MNNLKRTRRFFHLALAAAVVAGCSRQSAAPKVASATPKVRIVQPKNQALKRIVEEPGSVQPYEETLLFARVPGYAQLLHDSSGRLVFDVGRRINGPKNETDKPGDVLAELQVPELVQKTAQKQAMVLQVQAEAEQTAKALVAAEANITVAEAMVGETEALHDYWTSQSKRVASLAKDGVVDTQNRDEARYQKRAAEGKLASAKAGVLKAKADRDKAESDVRAAKSRVDVAKADAAAEEAMLRYAKIRAPYDGVITARKVVTGKLVQPPSGPDDWLFKVARLDPVRVVVAIPEADAELIEENAEVKVFIPEHPSNTTLKGKVARTSWALEPGSRTLRTEIDLPNKEGQLRPGMYVYAYVTHEFPFGWTVPVSTVAKEENATVCYVIENGKAVRTPVKIGPSDGHSVVIRKLVKSDGGVKTEDFTGNESIAATAAGLSDGLAVQVEP